MPDRGQSNAPIGIGILRWIAENARRVVDRKIAAELIQFREKANEQVNNNTDT